ncbi:MAG: DUF1631 family protein [Pseudoxanthomonas sp.]|nr:DUF1631 family protein [Pseudoxanthomonas sp.]
MSNNTFQHPQPAASSRDLVLDMRRRSTEHLQAVLARVFARADDWLFDLAKKDGVPDGSPYLHAMRALRTSRAPIERGFRDHLDRGFEGLGRQLKPADADGTPELTLLEESELEQHLATNLIAEAITRIHGNQLDELSARLARMLGIATLDPELSPRIADGAVQVLRARADP